MAGKQIAEYAAPSLVTNDMRVAVQSAVGQPFYSVSLGDIMTTTGVTSLRMNRRIASFGDSRTARGYTSSFGQRREFIGMQYWVSFLTRQRVDMPYDLNFGVNGDTTAQMLARISAVLESDADAVMLLGATNDFNDSGVTIAQTIENLQAIRDQILAVGKILIVLAEMPRGDTTYTTYRLGSNLYKIFKVRAEILSWQGAYPGVYVVDPWELMASPASSTGDAIAGYLYDGLHQSAAGGHVLGLAIQPVIEAIYPPRPIAARSNSDLYSASYPRGNLVANAMMDGTSGTKSSGALGTVATSYILLGETGLTVTGSKVTDSAGKVWQQIVISGTPSGATQFVELRQVLTTGNVSAGDVLEAVCEIEVDASAAGYWGLQQAILTIVDGVSNYASDGDPYNTDATGPTVAFAGTSRTTQVTIAAGSLTSLYWQLKVYGISAVAMAMTLRVRAVSVRKVI